MLIFFLSSFFVVSAESRKWLVVEKNESYFLLSKKNEKKYPIITEGGIPIFHQEKKLNEDYLLLVYQSGSVGTSQIITTYRALIVRNDLTASLGDYPYSYEGIDDDELMPSWEIKQDKLFITDLTHNISVKIDL